MKRTKLYLIAVLLAAAGTYNGVAFGQEDRSSEQQQEKEMQREILEQKKAFNEQRKQVEEQHRDAARKVEESMKELEKLKEFDFDIDMDVDEGNNVRIFRRGVDRSYRMPDNNFMLGVPDVPDVPRVHVYGYGADAERTSWNFTKSVKENSFKKEYTFDVEKTAKSVTMSVSGDCKEGEIRIKILTPQGKTFSDTVIDEFGNLNVRKSFNISETENQDKTGEWKFQINSDKATGYFKISFQTY